MSNLLVVEDGKVLSEVAVEVRKDKVPVGGREVPAIESVTLGLGVEWYGRLAELSNCGDA